VDEPVTHNLVYATSAPGKAWKEIGVWLGVPIMVSSGLLAFAMQWRTIARAFSGFGKSSGTSGHEALVAATEVPTSWFAIGTAITGAGVIAIASAFFGVPWYYGILAVGMTFFLSLVACRATGETDITPIGAMGKIMQLTYGVLIPQSTTANLMTASITSSASGASADLLNDLKSGYLLGANPRRQFVAQISGLLSGTIATVIGFHMLVPNATFLTGDGTTPPKFPAPAAQTWKAVAEVMKHGVANMHPAHQQAIVVGLAIGAILLGLEVALPKIRAVPAVAHGRRSRPHPAVPVPLQHVPRGRARVALEPVEPQVRRRLPRADGRGPDCRNQSDGRPRRGAQQSRARLGSEVADRRLTSGASTGDVRGERCT
jgi:hypothetical protein